MRYLALACDYDGTLAGNGWVEDRTVEALGRLRNSGRRLVLVTGRRVEDVVGIFPSLDLFDRVVAENGAVLMRPGTREEVSLGEPPPPQFLAALRDRGVDPLAVGQVVVATWQPHENTVLETIRDLGLELQVVFNKGAIMVLPSGVNKATGLGVALGELGLSPRNAVGVGDAENDHAFLNACECAVAVANALPMLKERCDWVTAADHGAGVVELIDALLDDDLARLAPVLKRHHVVLGEREDGTPLAMPPYGANVLLTGASGSGKSTLATGLLERLAAGGYQFCIVDPEGDYAPFAGAAQLGDAKRTPSADEVIELLARPEQSLIVNLLGLKLEDRPPFFAALLPRLQELRSRTARPHWIVVDEAHHLMPADWEPMPTLPPALHNLLLITVHPDHLARAALAAVDTVIAVGQPLVVPMRALPASAGAPPATLVPPPGHAGVWSTHLGAAPTSVRILPSEADHRRHRRKYAEGELGEDKSFFFRGPQGKLNLRAQNLQMFLQIADGVDDDTWRHHLRAGDYSQWMRQAIKDPQLAAEAAAVEAAPDADPRESRRRIRAAVEQRYTLPG
ncbi:MAG TPA: HAD-IIB family hydrolase [Candidatus Dormibacteraeota bacterium]|nr:HAD-IIB family hydrolase [Candidatus Dormibacteraeota bacterium]